jgi:L-cysteate sulfo-lyase
MALQERIQSPKITPEALRETVGKLPRVRFAHIPTALEEMPRLREELGANAPRLFVKRDDLTGLAFGGNKVRHMEFRLADVLAKGCDTIVVANVAQSNHARLHTALAARFGLTTYILKPPSKKDHPVNGNLLLDHILGARIVEASSADQEVLDRELAELVAKLEGEGRKVYNAVTDKFSKVAGTCGYVLASMELMDQLEAQGARVDHIFMAAGSSTAGLALAGKLLGAGYKVHPVSVGGSRADIEESVCRLANGVADLLGIDERLEPGDIVVHDEYVGERYGIPTNAGLEAMALAGRREGLVLDPVYTSKAFSAMIDQIRRGAIGPDEAVVFVHSGGLPIVFAYAEEILELLP